MKIKINKVPEISQKTNAPNRKILCKTYTPFYRLKQIIRLNKYFAPTLKLLNSYTRLVAAPAAGQVLNFFSAGLVLKLELRQSWRKACGYREGIIHGRGMPRPYHKTIQPLTILSLRLKASTQSMHSKVQFNHSTINLFNQSTIQLSV